jgi:hypothetical protein
VTPPKKLTPNQELVLMILKSGHLDLLTPAERRRLGEAALKLAVAKSKQGRK